MESLFFNLLQILTALHEKLAAMLRATEKHNAALRNNDIAAIQQAVKELDSISAQAKFLDKKREEIQRALEAKLHLPAGATLSETLVYAPAQAAQDLNKIAQSLRETTEAINQMVQINKILARQALQFNDILIKVLQPGQATYNPGGQTSVAKETVSLINRTV
ncbi:flagellar protein FlgN [Desulforamulus putei]|uniref:Flagellar biosynthesis/type III secretory pathway chaperone n=1 Tax=Desulforamulus putei DSM 12395 TaxID=1121429 RepID=A0A1M5AYD7_9FIRM|nr:flagellar protein FlgN [Desulforamulus putei]SHF34922.1 Flagellar biosynthesis/type III secretory pathway chaperone [Desulforamulus putei DSM 12395]